MTKISFYTQQRKDGGRRTGIEINGEPVLGRFEQGSGDDSALLWWVDIRCEGDHLPSDPDEVRSWLLEDSGIFPAALRRIGEELSSGIDFSEPISRPIAYLEEGVSACVVCSAINRLDAADMAKILMGISSNWRELLASLAPLEPVTS